MRTELASFLVVPFCLAACGSAGGGDPEPPAPGDVCAEQRTATTSDGHDVVVCERFFDEALFVHLPPAPANTDFVGLAFGGYKTLDGRIVPMELDSDQQRAEAIRHGLAIYRFDHRDDAPSPRYVPTVIVSERALLAPFLGQSLEGTISKRIGTSPEGASRYEDATTVPIRLRFASMESRDGEPGPESGVPDGVRFKIQLTVENADVAVTAGDGSCMPSLGSQGEGNPFFGRPTPPITGQRVASMHVFGDDKFVFLYDDGPSVMGGAWFTPPASVVAKSPSLDETYKSVGHGTPGSVPALTLTLAKGGGTPCTATR